MATPTDGHCEAAQRLLAQECAVGAGGDDVAAAAGRLYERLFRALAPVLGAAGFRALFARSVKLSRARFPALRELAMPGDIRSEDARVAPALVTFLRTLAPEAVLPVVQALYSTLFAVLATFIGEPLMWRLVQRACASNDGSSSKESE